MRDRQGGFIGATVTPTTSAASGIWSLREAERFQRSGTWVNDPYFSSVALLLHMDGSGATFTDSSGTPKTITAYGNATQSSDESKFGGKSAVFDGDNDYLLTGTSSGLSLGTDDFTVECWVRATSTPNDDGIFDCRSGLVGTAAQRQDGFTLTAFSSSVIRIFSDGILIASSGTTYVNQWVHVAVVRSSGTLQLFIDGISQGTSSSARDMTNNDFVIGAGRYGNVAGSEIPSPGASFPGYIDEFRVTKFARYSANFTPSTAAFPDA